MYDLKKVNENFQEFLKTELDEKFYRFEELEITEELTSQQEAFHIPSGIVAYFLAIEDEKPVVYLHASAKADLDVVAFIGEDGFERYDVANGNEDELAKYETALDNVEPFEEFREIMKR